MVEQTPHFPPQFRRQHRDAHERVSWRAQVALL